MTHSTGLTSSASPRWLDGISLLILAIISVAIRYSTLPVRIINVDEAQYESRAAYLLATDQSTYDVPHGPVVTTGLFKVLAQQFGPYCMPQVRALVLLITMLIAWMVFAIVRSETNRWWGLLAGSVFLLANPYVGGYQVNREWFSLLPALIGWCLYWVSWRRQGWRWAALVYLAGVALGMAVWFKFQAVPLSAAVAMMMAFDAAMERKWRRTLFGLTWYALGGITAAVLYLAPFAVHGTLGEHLQFVFGFKLPYAAGGGFDLSFVTWLITSFYLFIQPSALAALAYPFAIGCIAVAVVRITGRQARPRSLLGSRTGLFFSFVLITCLVAAQLGGRFFDHYYLYLVPSLSILFTLGLRSLFELRNWSWDVAAGSLILLLMDRAALALASSRLGPHSGTHFMILGGAVAASVMTFNWALGRFRQLASTNTSSGAFAARPAVEEDASPPPAGSKTIWASAMLGVILGLLFLVAGELGVSTYRTLSVTRADPTTTYADSRVGDAAALIKRLAESGDRAFVWGWKPELYSLTQLEPASRYVICQYVVTDEGVLNEFTAQQRRLLMRDLAERPPEFFCNAHDLLPLLTSPEDYDLSRFPELQAFVDANYEKLTAIDNVEVYVRRGRHDD